MVGEPPPPGAARAARWLSPFPLSPRGSRRTARVVFLTVPQCGPPPLGGLRYCLAAPAPRDSPPREQAPAPRGGTTRRSLPPHCPPPALAACHLPPGTSSALPRACHLREHRWLALSLDSCAASVPPPPPPGPLHRETRWPGGSIKWLAAGSPPLLTRVLQVAAGAAPKGHGDDVALLPERASHSFLWVRQETPRPRSPRAPNGGLPPPVGFSRARPWPRPPPLRRVSARGAGQRPCPGV